MKVKRNNTSSKKAHKRAHKDSLKAKHARKSRSHHHRKTTPKTIFSFWS